MERQLCAPLETSEAAEDAVEGDEEEEDDNGERFALWIVCADVSPACCESRMLSRFLRASRAISHTDWS